MAITHSPSRLALFGQPVSHSLSPRIHAAFGAQVGIRVDYRAIEAGHDEFPQALAAFAREGGIGANVTLPLKIDAFALCSSTSERARRAGSVNTLILDGDTWRGDSTDGAGLLRDLRQRHGFDPTGRRVLLLGAGGAARAVAAALIDERVHDLMIVNRTRQRTIELTRSLASDCVFTCDLAKVELLDDQYELVINATSLGHGDARFDLPARLLAANALCYDLSYGRIAQPFLDWARHAGAANACDGIGMLVEQAAEAFELWHGVRPATAPVHTLLAA